MTTPALVKQSDLRRLAAVVKEKGVCVEIDFKRSIIRISPDIPDNHRQKAIEYYADIDL